MSGGHSLNMEYTLNNIHVDKALKLGESTIARENQHLLQQQDGGGHGHHLLGQDALTGPKEAQHPPNAGRIL